MSDTEHRWGVGVVLALTEEQARQVASHDDMATRAEVVRELLDSESWPKAIRGPLCERCGVQRHYLDRQPDKLWPCPGRRPEAMGGQLRGPRPEPTRQATRAQRRAAEKAGRPDPNRRDPVAERLHAAIAADRLQRRERKDARERSLAGWEALATNFDESTDLDPDEYWGVPLVAERCEVHP